MPEPPIIQKYQSWNLVDSEIEQEEIATRRSGLLGLNHVHHKSMINEDGVPLNPVGSYVLVQSPSSP